jgi:hypothetical protein
VSGSKCPEWNEWRPARSDHFTPVSGYQVCQDLYSRHNGPAVYSSKLAAIEEQGSTRAQDSSVRLLLDKAC